MTAKRTFSKTVWAYYKKYGRHDLPWRKTRDPYKILVSEVMLQQTQVERALPFYKSFIQKFPTAKKLAAAPLAEVLKAWQGLGYNRRAKMLHEAAKGIAVRGAFPKTVEDMEKLPGVGPYTASAVAAFAFNQDVIVIETNIRTAVIHHFFQRGAGVALTRSRIGTPSGTSLRRRAAGALRGEAMPAPRILDTQIAEILSALLPKGKSREWYSALMDYGAYLKKSGVQLNARSAHHTQQKKFAGSSREARGAVLRELAKSRGDASGLTPEAMLLNVLGKSRRLQLRAALAALALEGLIQRHGHYVGLPQSLSSESLAPHEEK